MHLLILSAFKTCWGLPKSALGSNGNVIFWIYLRTWTWTLIYFRNLFSSEKVLQMSYANYQWVSDFFFYIYIFFNLVSEARRHWSKNSKIRALWMSGKNGGPKYSIRVDRNKVYPSRFRRLRIWGEKNGVRIIGERSTFRVRPRMSDVLLLAWAMGTWAIMVLCVGKIFMLLRRALVGILNIGPEAWIGKWSHRYIHLMIHFLRRRFWRPKPKPKWKKGHPPFALCLRPKKRSFFFFPLTLSGSFHSFYHSWLFFFREREACISSFVYPICV